MPKHQTGIRIDRILFKQFQEICKIEKLRPGEAVESLMRLAVQAGSITGVSVDNPKSENTARTFDETLFRSRLARLKTRLEGDRRGNWERLQRIRIFHRTTYGVGTASRKPGTSQRIRSCPDRLRQTIRGDAEDLLRKGNQRSQNLELFGRPSRQEFIEQFHHRAN